MLWGYKYLNIRILKYNLLMDECVMTVVGSVVRFVLGE
jgi:hypothetical protein